MLQKWIIRKDRIIKSKNKLNYTYLQRTERSFLMYRFSANFMKFMKTSMKESKLSGMLGFTLTIIHDNPGVTVSQISTKWGSTVSAISQVIKKLEAEGLIKKEKKEGNAKEVHLYITDVGNMEVEKYKKFNETRMESFVDKYFRDFTQEDLDTYFKVLAAMTEFYEIK